MDFERSLLSIFAPPHTSDIRRDAGSDYLTIKPLVGPYLPHCPLGDLEQPSPDSGPSSRLKSITARARANLLKMKADSKLPELQYWSKTSNLNSEPFSYMLDNDSKLLY